MWILVTAQAVGEALEYALWMRFAVTLLAARNCLVLVIVTLDAGYIVVLGGTCLKKLEFLAMAGATVCIWSIRAICDHKWHVGLVTLAALLV